MMVSASEGKMNAPINEDKPNLLQKQESFKETA